MAGLGVFGFSGVGPSSMDSLGNQSRIEGFLVNLYQDGKPVRLLDDGAIFQALISSEADFDPSFPLGSDIREKSIIGTLRSMVPQRLLGASAPSQIRASVDGEELVLTRRQDNVASPFISFEVLKVL
jgi:hypothetical protein